MRIGTKFFWVLAVTGLLLLGPGCKNAAPEKNTAAKAPDKAAPEKKAAAKAPDKAAPEKKAAVKAPEKPAPAKKAADGSGFATPTALGQAFIAAASSHDAAKISAIFPSDERLDSAITCAEGKKSLKEEVARERKKALRDLVERAGGETFTWIGLELKRDAMKFTKGQEQKGCVFQEPCTIQRVRLNFNVTKDGETKDDHETVTLMQIGDGGRWYLVDM